MHETLTKPESTRETHEAMTSAFLQSRAFDAYGLFGDHYPVTVDWDWIDASGCIDAPDFLPSGHSVAWMLQDWGMEAIHRED